MDTNGRKGRRDRTGQREETNSKGTQMTLVEEETHKGTDIPMGTTDTKASPSTITTSDQQEVLPAGISSKKRRPKTSDQRSKTPGGGPEVMGCLVGSEAKTDPE